MHVRSILSTEVIGRKRDLISDLSNSSLSKDPPSFDGVDGVSKAN